MTKQLEVSDADSSVIEEINSTQMLVDGYCGVTINGGVARFSFYSIYFDAITQRNKKRVILHLQMPLITVEGVQQGFAAILTELRSSGMIKDAKTEIPASLN